MNFVSDIFIGVNNEFIVDFDSSANDVTEDHNFDKDPLAEDCGSPQIFTSSVKNEAFENFDISNTISDTDSFNEDIEIHTEFKNEPWDNEAENVQGNLCNFSLEFKQESFETEIIEDNHCDFCEEEFCSKKDVVQHKKRIHTIPIDLSIKPLKLSRENGPIFVCKYCEKIFEDRINFMDHISKQHECDLCNQSFVQFDHLKKHKIKQHKFFPDDSEKSSNYVTCQHCDKMFKRSGILKHENQCAFNFDENIQIQESEILEVEQVPSPRYNCDLCDKSFRLNSTLISHKVAVHIFKKELVKCGLCDKSFKDIYLQKHKCPKKEEQKKLKKFECNLCGKRFHRHNELKRHKEYLLCGKENYECHICKIPMVGKRKLSKLKQHLKFCKANFQKESFQCNHCRKIFSYKTAYITHLAQIHDERSCDLCNNGKKYSNIDFVHHLLFVHFRRLCKSLKNENYPFLTEKGKIQPQLRTKVLAIYKRKSTTTTSEELISISRQYDLIEDIIDIENDFEGIDEAYQCTICLAYLDSIVDLRIHLSTSHFQYLIFNGPPIAYKECPYSDCPWVTLDSTDSAESQIECFLEHMGSIHHELINEYLEKLSLEGMKKPIVSNIQHGIEHNYSRLPTLDDLLNESLEEIVDD